MADLYGEQRAWLLQRWPNIGDALPAEAPAAPAVRPMALPELRRVLREPANNHASLCIVVGWGDGTVVDALIEDPLLRQKQLIVALLDGDEPGFAASLRRPLIERVKGMQIQLTRLRGEDDVIDILCSSFAGHRALPPIAGCDLVAEHPLSERAERCRAELLPRFVTRLADRPTAFGNDIGDSFIGLHQLAKNARALLPAPNSDELQGWYGKTPIVSIAAGPSLKRHLPRLRELQDRCILVACDAVLHGLIDEGIQPHFVTPLERVPKTSAMTARAGESTAWFAGMPLVHPDVIAPFGERTLFIAAGDQLYDWAFPKRRAGLSVGQSSGTLSVAIASLLSDGDLYLVGHDLSRDATATHWGGAAFAADGWKTARAAADLNGQWQGGYEMRMIPGNSGALVEATAWWDRFREDIVVQVRQLVGLGRKVYNVNAHDRVGAVIEGALAAPLPDPSSLSPFAPRPLPARDMARYEQWAERARKLPEDTREYRKRLASLRDDVVAARKLGPDAWPLEALAARATLGDGVSEGNRSAFTYFLRSGLHNVTAEMHHRRRTPSRARSRWETLRSLEYYVHAIDNAVAWLEPAMQEIADTYAR